MPEAIKALTGRQKIKAVSLFARKSAAASCLNSNQCVGCFKKDSRGIPVPYNGTFWSISHKPDFVAGVVSRKPVGIDIEKIKNIPDALFERIVDLKERELFKTRDRQIIFFKAFTAKEAVVKKTTHGIKGLSKVKIKKIVDDKFLSVQYSGKKYLVENFYFDGYLASVTKDHFDVQWTIE